MVGDAAAAYMRYILVPIGTLIIRPVPTFEVRTLLLT
jgi:hypothetical protein